MPFRDETASLHARIARLEADLAIARAERDEARAAQRIAPPQKLVWRLLDLPNQRIDRPFLWGVIIVAVLIAAVMIGSKGCQMLRSISQS